MCLCVCELQHISSLSHVVRNVKRFSVVSVGGMLTLLSLLQDGLRRLSGNEYILATKRKLSSLLYDL